VGEMEAEVPVIASLFSYDTTFCVVVQWSFVPYHGCCKVMLGPGAAA
jgi:hypothetical protein